MATHETSKSVAGKKAKRIPEDQKRETRKGYSKFKEEPKWMQRISTKGSHKEKSAQEGWGTESNMSQTRVGNHEAIPS